MAGFLALLLTSAACSRDQGSALPPGESLPTAPADQEVPSPEVSRENSESEPEPAQTVLGTTQNGALVETPTPESTPTVEPVVPLLSASRQVLDDDGRLVIDQVVSDQNGWLVVYSDLGGQKGEVLGFVPVEEGQFDDVEVAIDPLLAGDALYAVIHQDAGVAGRFEFPGPDSPLVFQQRSVEDHFMIDNRASVPEIVVSDQDVLDNGVVTVDRVSTNRPGWLAIHLDNEGEPGQLLAYAPVRPGVSEDVMLLLVWRDATTTLHAALYDDAGERDVFEDPSIDTPVRLEEVPISTSFNVQYPPDVYVMPQPVIDGSIVIEKAVSYGPGWAVVYFDDEGRLGNIIGQASLEDGINEQIVVPVVESAVTPFLHVMLHQDTDEVGEFEFPRADPMVLHEGMVPDPFTFRTDAGNYLITRDQPDPADDLVHIPLIAVDENAWIAIYADSEGELGDRIGLEWLPPGLHKDVKVNIDREERTLRLHAVLHIDLGNEKEFEYPDGVDVPLQRNSSIIDSPFTLLIE